MAVPTFDIPVLGTLTSESDPKIIAALQDIKNILTGNIDSSNLSDSAKKDASVPTGTILEWTGDVAPDGFLLCNGISYLTNQYQELFNIIGYKYGGSTTTFKVPDLRGRVSVGKGTHPDVDTLGESDGTSTSSRTIYHYHDDGSLLCANHYHTDGSLYAVSHYHSAGSLKVDVPNLILYGSVGANEPLNKSTLGTTTSFAWSIKGTASGSSDNGYAWPLTGVAIGASANVSGQSGNSGNVDVNGQTSATQPDVSGNTGSSFIPYLVVNKIIKF